MSVRLAIPEEFNKPRKEWSAKSAYRQPARKGCYVCMLTPARINEIRSRFPVFGSKIYLNSCSQGALSDAVRKGFVDYLETWDQHGSPWDLWIEEYEATRRTFADFLGAQPDEVAIIPSASAGINSVAAFSRCGGPVRGSSW
jgi:selenocysteine lyase/cysteine desulfurase